MSIGDWPPRQIKRLWMLGLAIEAVLILAPLAWGRFASKEPVSSGQRQLAEFTARMDSVDRGLLPPLPPLSDSQRAALRAVIRDSLGFEFVRRGDTTAVVPRTAEARALSESFGRGMRRLGDAIATIIVILALIYLPIPLVVMGVTVLWLWRRRRLKVGVADV